jgi:nucleoside-diphosphate-sugar epimerase
MTVGVTGANGYVGGRILRHLRARGIEAVALVRRPQEAAGAGSARRYALAEPLEAGVLDGIDAVVHAAYDLAARGERIAEVNVRGSLPLLEALAAKGGRLVLISSLAAFDGARSRYGQAKLALERAVAERGGVSIRPGLVFGAGAGGLFGALVGALGRTSIAPLPGGGWQRQFLAHDEHLAQLVAAVLAGGLRAERPFFAAHEAPTTLRAIAEQIASARGRRLRVVPLPEAPLHGAMRAAERTGAALPFRSDSLLGLLHPIPLDQVAALERGPVRFPALSPELWAR